MRRIRVLLVEHNPAVQTLMQDYFRELEYIEVAGTAADGVEGMEAVRRLEPDLVIMGLVMPRLSGIGMLRALAGRPSRPKILVASRVDSPGIIRRALELGADFYLIKPLNLAELPEIIAGLCGGDWDKAPAARLLLDMGARAGTREFGCARTAAGFFADAGEDVQLKEIYIRTARAEQSTPGCVEKNIRSLVGKLMELDTPVWRALWDERPAKRPTNGDFLRAMARRLREKEKR